VLSAAGPQETDPQGRITMPSAVYSMRTNGGRLKLLIADAAQPSVSPNANRIAFVSQRDHNGQIQLTEDSYDANELYVAGLDGQSVQRLTSTRDSNESTPSWSSDGAQIAYRSGTEGPSFEIFSLFAINADGSCAAQLAKGSASRYTYGGPAWRPRNSRVGPRRCT
jgi:Tol biopolymer transport system component